VKGFSLVELLVAMLITLLVTAAALPLLGPALDAFQVQPESADLHQRARVGTEALLRDLLMAGAGPYMAGSTGPLHRVLAPVLPYRALASPPAASGSVRTDTVTLLYVPSTPAQTALAQATTAGALEIALEPSASCPASSLSRFCGIEADDQVLIFDRNGGWGVFEVDLVDGLTGRLQLKDDAPRQGFERSSSVAKVEAVTYFLRPDPESGASQLVRAKGRGPAQSVVDHVVGLEFQYFGDPQPPRIIERAPESTSDDRSTYGPLPPELTETVEGWPSGENCVFTRVEGRPEPRLAQLGASTLVAMPAALVSDGPWCPDAGALNRFDADLLRIRRVRFTLRVQTALAVLRGPASALFTIGGSARSGGRYVPDVQVQFDVTPRNLNVSR
jgi:prepilin-type N-terminal cleavage/methylation domain-containing protein